MKKLLVLLLTTIMCVVMVGQSSKIKAEDVTNDGNSVAYFANDGNGDLSLWSNTAHTVKYPGEGVIWEVGYDGSTPKLILKDGFSMNVPEEKHVGITIDTGVATNIEVQGTATINLLGKKTDIGSLQNAIYASKLSLNIYANNHATLQMPYPNGNFRNYNAVAINIISKAQGDLNPTHVELKLTNVIIDTKGSINVGGGYQLGLTNRDSKISINNSSIEGSAIIAKDIDINGSLIKLRCGKDFEVSSHVLSSVNLSILNTKVDILSETNGIKGIYANNAFTMKSTSGNARLRIKLTGTTDGHGNSVEAIHVGNASTAPVFEGFDGAGVLKYYVDGNGLYQEVEQKHYEGDPNYYTFVNKNGTQNPVTNLIISKGCTPTNITSEFGDTTHIVLPNTGNPESVDLKFSMEPFYADSRVSVSVETGTGLVDAKLYSENVVRVTPKSSSLTGTATIKVTSKADANKSYTFTVIVSPYEAPGATATTKQYENVPTNAFATNSDLGSIYDYENEKVKEDAVIKVNGKQLVYKDDYTLTSGSTVVTLTDSFLSTLTPGKYEVNIGGITFNKAIAGTKPVPTPDPGKKDESCEKVIGPTWHWNNDKGICEDVGVVGTATR